MHRTVAFAMAFFFAGVPHPPLPSLQATSFPPIRYSTDCNGNGIEDVIDIENGVGVDRNGDGALDACGPSSRWQRYGARVLAKPFDSLYVAVLYASDWGVRIEFAIGRTCPVRVMVGEENASQHLVHHRTMKPGLHAVTWRPTDAMGHLRLEGQGVVHVSTPKDSTVIPLRWAWRDSVSGIWDQRYYTYH